MQLIQHKLTCKMQITFIVDVSVEKREDKVSY